MLFNARPRRDASILLAYTEAAKHVRSVPHNPTFRKSAHGQQSRVSIEATMSVPVKPEELNRKFGRAEQDQTVLPRKLAANYLAPACVHQAMAPRLISPRLVREHALRPR